MGLVVGVTLISVHFSTLLLQMDIQKALFSYKMNQNWVYKQPHQMVEQVWKKVRLHSLFWSYIKSASI